MKKEQVSVSVIKRLPRYYRFLSELLAKGIVKISSRELAEIMGITASQIRQDLNCFGGFGQQGYGYNVPALHKEIASILGIDRLHAAVLIGAGNLGRAMATHISFQDKGFRLIGIFDRSELVIGETIQDHTVLPVERLDAFCRENKPDVAILCIPKAGAKELAEQLIGLGIRSFWNFSHYDIGMEYPDTAVENVHLGDSLMTLCYKINAREHEEQSAME